MACLCIALVCILLHLPCLLSGLPVTLLYPCSSCPITLYIVHTPEIQINAVYNTNMQQSSCGYFPSHVVVSSCRIGPLTSSSSCPLSLLHSCLHFSTRCFPDIWIRCPVAAEQIAYLRFIFVLHSATRTQNLYDVALYFSGRTEFQSASVKRSRRSVRFERKASQRYSRRPTFERNEREKMARVVASKAAASRTDRCVCVCVCACMRAWVKWKDTTWQYFVCNGFSSQWFLTAFPPTSIGWLHSQHMINYMWSYSLSDCVIMPR